MKPTRRNAHLLAMGEGGPCLAPVCLFPRRANSLYCSAKCQRAASRAGGPLSPPAKYAWIERTRQAKFDAYMAAHDALEVARTEYQAVYDAWHHEWKRLQALSTTEKVQFYAGIDEAHALASGLSV